MTQIKTLDWPKVLTNDHGIRAAFNADACFYCGSKVGDVHGKDCVCVSKLVKYDVFSDGMQVGMWQNYEPHSWDQEACNSMRNESSWCADNAVDNIEWLDTAFAQGVRAQYDGWSECACAKLEFRFAEIADSGPFIELPPGKVG